jgi:hypothetical protein
LTMPDRSRTPHTPRKLALDGHCTAAYRRQDQ